MKRTHKKVSRRQILAGAAAASALITTAPAILAQTRKPIRLGVLNSFTGGAAYSGENAFRGMQLYLDGINGMIAGRKVELIKEDDQFNPQIGLQKAKKLLESDGADMILGPQSSGVALAVLNYVKQRKGFLVVTGAGLSSLTYDGYPYLFRTCWSSQQLIDPLANWLFDNIAKTAVVTAADYAGGRDLSAEFSRPYTAKGGNVIRSIFPPLGTTDFSPYLTTLKSLKTPLSYNFYPGTEALRFIQQYDQLGLKETTTFAGFALIDSATLPALGRSARDLIMCTPYTPVLDTSENKKFVSAYSEKYKVRPDFYSEFGLVAARVVDEALKAVDGDASNHEKLADAMTKVSFDAPRGPFRFDPATRNPIQNTYITKVQDIGGNLDEVVLATIKDTKAPAKKPG